MSKTKFDYKKIIGIVVGIAAANIAVKWVTNGFSFGSKGLGDPAKYENYILPHEHISYKYHHKLVENKIEVPALYQGIFDELTTYYEGDPDALVMFMKFDLSDGADYDLKVGITGAVNQAIDRYRPLASAKSGV